MRATTTATVTVTKGSGARCGPYFRQVAGLLTVGSVCGALMNTAVVLPSVLLGHAIDTVVAYGQGRADSGAVNRAALLLIAGTLATDLPRVGKRRWLGICKNRIQANVRTDAVRGVLSWPARRLHVTPVGDVMARVIGDVAVLGTGVGELIVETWDTLLFSLSLIVVMFVYDPQLALLGLVPVPLALALAKAAGRWVSRRTLRSREANARLTTFVQEALTGLRLLRVSGRGRAFVSRLGELADQQADAELAATRLNAVLAPVYTALVTSGVVAVIWLGGHRVLAGAMSVGGLVAFLGLFARFTGRAFRIPQMANRVQAAAAAYTRLAPLLADPAPRADQPRRASWLTEWVAGPRTRTEPCRPRLGPARVTLNRVTFTYPNASGRALDEVTLDVPAGALVAVTGPVGAGKTALARLIVGLYQPDAGRLRIDGADPYGWTAAEREDLGYLPQGHPVFSGSIAENVVLTDTRDAELPPCGDSERSARLTESLRVGALDDDIAAMPSGATTGIGELGVRVSGGQRQRIALARALAAPTQRPRLLVLDDPFSAVDVHTEVSIIAALRAAVGPTAAPEHRATVLLCSTRLAAFVDADLVVVLKAGRIIETGTHAALLTGDGLYARIFHAQQHSQIPSRRESGE